MKRISSYLAGILAFSTIFALPAASRSSIYINAPVLSISYLAMQMYSQPSQAFYENIIIQDARGWFADRYVRGSMGDVGFLSGSYSSGNWTAEAYYYYIDAWDGTRKTGWVIFRFRAGSIQCLTYHNFPSSCRRPNYY